MRISVIFNHSPMYEDCGRCCIPVWYHAENHSREIISISELQNLRTFGFLEEMRWRDSLVLSSTAWRFRANSGVV